MANWAEYGKVSTSVAINQPHYWLATTAIPLSIQQQDYKNSTSPGYTWPENLALLNLAEALRSGNGKRGPTLRITEGKRIERVWSAKAKTSLLPLPEAGHPFEVHVRNQTGCAQYFADLKQKKSLLLQENDWFGTSRCTRTIQAEEELESGEEKLKSSWRTAGPSDKRFWTSLQGPIDGYRVEKGREDDKGQQINQQLLLCHPRDNRKHQPKLQDNFHKDDGGLILEVGDARYVAHKRNAEQEPSHQEELFSMESESDITSESMLLCIDEGVQSPKNPVTREEVDQVNKALSNPIPEAVAESCESFFTWSSSHFPAENQYYEGQISQSEPELHAVSSHQIPYSVECSIAPIMLMPQDERDKVRELQLPLLTTCSHCETECLWERTRVSTLEAFASSVVEPVNQPSDDSHWIDMILNEHYWSKVPDDKHCDTDVQTREQLLAENELIKNIASLDKYFESESVSADTTGRFDQERSNKVTSDTFSVPTIIQEKPPRDLWNIRERNQPNSNIGPLNIDLSDDQAWRDFVHGFKAQGQFKDETHSTIPSIRRGKKLYNCSFLNDSEELLPLYQKSSGLFFKETSTGLDIEPSSSALKSNWIESNAATVGTYQSSQLNQKRYDNNTKLVDSSVVANVSSTESLCSAPSEKVSTF
ncbi:hypothetical protein BDZ91DRAFT_810352 [Kalaharituber pfeilii]|nr:hypothetical protein BDZ91DRAFT_810352 [Kalaharituber pfeilii]